jgi:hypothetical protein
MTVTLPDDVLFLIAAELGQERDFDTLFSCALAGRRFAVSALTSLYRCVLHLRAIFISTYA